MRQVASTGGLMCFSAQADLIVGAAVVAVGVDSCRHLRGRNELFLGALPLLLGIHQLTEAFVWWGLEGRVPAGLGRMALYAYLGVAFVVLPILVPLSVLMLEPLRPRRWRMVPLLGLGTVVGSVLLAALVRGPVTAAIRPWHLSYGVALSYGGLLVALYITAVCGTLMLSSYHHIVVFGASNIVVIVALVMLLITGFTSLWCAYAALSTGAIALHLRYATTHRAGSFTPVPLA